MRMRLRAYAHVLMTPAHSHAPTRTRAGAGSNDPDRESAIKRSCEMRVVYPQLGFCDATWDQNGCVAASLSSLVGVLLLPSAQLVHASSSSPSHPIVKLDD